MIYDIPCVYSCVQEEEEEEEEEMDTQNSDSGYLDACPYSPRVHVHLGVAVTLSVP